MELWVLSAIFAISFGLLIWGFSQRSWLAAVIGSILLMISGGVLFFDGYNTYTSCTSTGCTDTTSLSYDVNGNISTISTQVIKVNGANNGFSYFAGVGAIFLGVFTVIIATMGKMSG